MHSPIVTPNEVKGFLGHSSSQPDRIFYVLDVTPRWEYLWELDGYCVKTPDGDLWTIHLTCPICRQSLTLKSEKKPLRVSPEGLEVEEFRCTWPAEFGGICKFGAALELPRPAQRYTVTNNGQRIRVDAIFKYTR